MTLDRELSESVERALFATGNDPHWAAKGRAQVLDDLVQLVYDHIKNWAPGGGLDGRDSAELASVGKVLAAAHDNLHRQRVAGIPIDSSNVTPLTPDSNVIPLRPDHTDGR